MIQKYHASSPTEDLVVAFSISFEKESLVARGVDVEHLREMLLRLARPILRNRGSLAFGGHLKETPDNFTIEL